MGKRIGSRIDPADYKAIKDLALAKVEPADIWRALQTPDGDERVSLPTILAGSGSTTTRPTIRSLVCSPTQPTPMRRGSFCGSSARYVSDSRATSAA